MSREVRSVDPRSGQEKVIAPNVFDLLVPAGAYDTPAKRLAIQTVIKNVLSGSWPIEKRALHGELPWISFSELEKSPAGQTTVRISTGHGLFFSENLMSAVKYAVDELIAQPVPAATR